MSIAQEKQKKQYADLVEKVNPKPPILKNITWAFFVGGFICILGQGIMDILKMWGYTQDEAAMLNSIILIFIGAVLTGLDIYDDIGKHAGAGSIVPITGFANSIVSPSIESKKEGYVFGVGAKMFIIAGPVIVYGTIASIIVGFLYFLVG